MKQFTYYCDALGMSIAERQRMSEEQTTPAAAPATEQAPETQSKQVGPKTEDNK